ncbi:2-amino-4-oxopentanoate thiolase subunit OrtA [Wansuia hejianensis]|uniref:2-amino-4-ketopentanoate thiolase n=1 Tax=Wansuia hejianensis TaxID=2763667 RepID=A0A926IHH8_9FIRM|nr:2-amino-4-oxopentanoate thiolase subunit OrtA [Wansuia hejianensis]MBC8590697.1 2-amino-4-ketopentanoate thiolase [Wansuia hejianensis]
MDAKQGDWIRIYNIVLDSNERASNLPNDTKKVPLEMWDKGFLLDGGANIGDIVEIETYIGRKVKGKLVEVNPYYNHDYGKSIPEILYIGRQARRLLGKEGEKNE